MDDLHGTTYTLTSIKTHEPETGDNTKNEYVTFRYQLSRLKEKIDNYWPIKLSKNISLNEHRWLY